jgi:hypothetical protein
MKPSKQVNLERTVTKCYIQKCLCSMNVSGVEIKSAIDTMKIQFKASESWLWQFSNRDWQ